ncbi:hypothetical protein BUALT_Bualt05G0165300 [Buddleja alternifolia]|uniref:Protein SIEVE ELEMENT OCCLUSION C n=1 Tax=Buddleja alternifolia TaxID=168488 RepID=A0AAV6XSH5_9LAMI|nr:hypothetical protein BUALT_Bualt05G0165300 [Buddleja alternifolia]
MSLLEDEHMNPIPSSSINEDFLTREVLLTHDPDDRHLDSEMLLQIVESTCCSTTENVSYAQLNEIGTRNIDLTGSNEPISFIVYKISNEILCQCFKDENLHNKTLYLLEMLSHYTWDAKVVLALASFAHSFGLFWLIMKLQSNNALAFSLAKVKHLPGPIGMLKPKFKAMNMLVKTMVKVTKVIISFEGMSLQYELVDDKAMEITKSKIYLATYWIFRSILVCSSQIADLRNLRLEQVHRNSKDAYFLFRHSDETVIAAWALHSVGNKLSILCHDLEQLVDTCRDRIETKLLEKLPIMFEENQIDNQNVLRTLFGLQNQFPFKNPTSQKQCGIYELKNKVIILLISKPRINEVFLLVQQTYSHPHHKKIDDNYVVLWVPIQSSNEWNRADKTSFEFLSNGLPWLSIRRPWSLNSAVVNHIKQKWDFEEDPIMVVLNENGKVTNRDAMDMVWIWGPKAFPFSSAREKELWEEENWTLDLMINGINPLLTHWVEEGKNVCIYGSNNLDWVRKFNAKMKELKREGIQLEVVYVGCKNPFEQVKNIIDTIDQENLCTSLILTKVHFFWLRLESIKRSLSHQDYTMNCDQILKNVEELLDCDDGWAVIGRGSFSTDMIKLDSKTLDECVELFPLWCRNVATLGLVGAIRSVFEPTFGGGNCHHNELVPYEEGLIEKTLICGSCQRPMEKFVLYQGLIEKCV